MIPRLILLLFLAAGSLHADSLSVLFLGDTHFGENYQYDPLYNRGVNYITERGYEYFFENVKPILNESEAVICNLETPLTRDINIISSRKPYLHWSDPDSTAKYFRKYNIQFVSLGNNHVFDMGLKGYETTVSALKKNSIFTVGAGKDIEESSGPLVIKLDTILFVIFSGFEYRPNYDTLYHFYAGNSVPGVNVLDTVRLNKEISSYRSTYPGAVIIVYPHWGSNYGQVTEKQKAFAHSWINAGADAVVGQGAHTLQPVEKYSGKYIFYNIGNFIFNTPGRYGSTGAKPYGLMVKMIVVNGVISYRLNSIYTNNKKSSYKLRLLDKNETGEIISEFFYEGVEFSLDSNNTVIILK